MAVELKTAMQLEAMREVGRVVAKVLDELSRFIEPGVSTLQMDQVAVQTAQKLGARCAFEGLYGFPAHLCTSINEELVHGIPRHDRIVKDGDIVTCDFGAELGGWFGDGARTFAVGSIRKEVRRLLDTAEHALRLGIERCRIGSRLSDIGNTIQTAAEKEQYAVIRDLVGHGIGRSPHEPPQVPNYGPPGKGMRLEPGMTLALEPMIALGSHEVSTLPDGWTVVTMDGEWCAHFEHTVAITDLGPQIMTLL